MAATQLPSSSVSTRLPTAEEVREYEKILRISEDVFSGTHPRLKVPQQFVRKVASRNQPISTTTTPTITQVQPGVLPVSPSRNLPQSTPAPAQPTGLQKTNTVNGPANATAASRINPKSASGIDPIFLTKSDDLVRAELQLQRQRVERVLREQLDQKKRLETRQKASIQDANPDFDVSDVLARAFQIVKPSPSSDVPGEGAPSDSFDENSFYSSRAPDSPQHQQKTPPAPPPNGEDPGTEGPTESYSDELQRLEALNRPESDQEMQDTYPTADHRSAHQHRQPHHEATPPHKAHESRQQVDAMEEPEYSPPAPGVAPMERVDGYEPPRAIPTGPRRRGPERTRYPRGSMSPADDVRVVRNHITSPAAPQPSRVSPLAIAKVPSFHPVKDSRPEYGPERQGSPEVPAQPLMPRKRRRLQDERDRSRPTPYMAQSGGPSKPYIKEEPVSPPPFADTPPTFRARQPQERSVYIDIASPRYTPVMERREPAYELEPYDEAHVDVGIQRTVSRLSTRRPMRDDQDLRRVASLHQARQPEYTREYIDQRSSHSMRTAPYTIVERPPQERTRYYEEVSVPPPVRRYVPAGEAPPSPHLHETYYEEEPGGRIVAQPRRIVVDEHGNQYYETVAPTPRIQAMPPPSSRIPRTDVYEERPQIHHASVRAASVLEDPYGGRRYVQEMPPPQGAYRRVTDYARPAPNEPRAYAAPFDAREPFPRSASVQVHDYVGRRPLDEPEIPRERIVRIPSVRPPTTRYEEPREVIQRVESVHPAGRDVSVYMDEDARRPREYIERPVYVTARPLAREERYYESGDPERIVIDGTRDAVHRVPQYR